MKKSASLAAIAVASLALTGVASAAPGDTDSVQVRSMTVSFATDHAHTPEGARQLFHRIRQAADEVCRIARNPVGYELWVQHSCEAQAVKAAVQSAGIPALQQHYKRGVVRTLVASR